MCDNFAAMHPSPGADVEHIVRLADRLFVMFHNDDGIALIAQVLQRVQQAVVVALVQTDGWLVQHIQHPGQARPDLAGQPDTLAFAAHLTCHLNG